MESGRVFADSRFGDLKNRADNALIRDLKTVRRELIDAGLSGTNVRFAHALIGRSIFIRYLEDRGILTEEYILNIARQNVGWTELLRYPAGRNGLDFSLHKSFYPRVLADKSFTYALFRNLAADFNGDMFRDVDEEEVVVGQVHLTLIQDLLFGDSGAQKKLFFYSYHFDIIPLDLISSIYEEFYHAPAVDPKKKNNAGKKSKQRQDGAYYTPPVLVEFLLSRVLTPAVLANAPRILDPACGSGIFLVEAFRRIVRYEWHKNKQPLTFEMLKGVLKDQIAGIEVNGEAASVTAFSLYLSMLHYLEPPAIFRQIELGNKLPNLVSGACQSANHFHCILPGSAFDTEFINSNPLRMERFGEGCADIVVGNPPWGAPGKKADTVSKERHNQIVKWCKDNKKPIGDKEASQAFLWRSLDFLKEKGKAAMLVSGGVLFKHNVTTQAFRSQWLSLVNLNEVFNFIHVRKLFFKGADSPFLSICFSKERQEECPTDYWSAKQAITINKTQAIVLSKYDRQILQPRDLPSMATWKSFWFGRKADSELLRFLGKKKRLLEFSDRDKCGRGYEIASKGKSADKLRCFKKSLVTASFSRYDCLEFVEPSEKIYRFGNLEIYDGLRLVVQKGIKEETDRIDQKGNIVARYEKKPYCFRHAFYGIKLNSPEEWMYQTILGILWSSVARYFFFMATSKWGLWYHEIYFEDELLQLPVVLDETNPATKQ
ncbi:MAG: N-6 DNA methylase, partial [bacterium]|nr:N-6 DNA methylase [bacterium]